MQNNNKKNCKKCGFEKYIVNKHYNLCFLCNNSRLEELKIKSNISISNRKNRSLQRTKLIKGKILADEVFYEECFNSSNHKCEECGCNLPTEFRNEDGKIVARWRYSHIIPKSIAPKLRHDVRNINHLCLKHHIEWENGDKEKMKIYKGNKSLFKQYF